MFAGSHWSARMSVRLTGPVTGIDDLPPSTPPAGSAISTIYSYSPRTGSLNANVIAALPPPKFPSHVYRRSSCIPPFLNPPIRVISSTVHGLSFFRSVDSYSLVTLFHYYNSPVCSCVLPELDFIVRNPLSLLATLPPPLPLPLIS